MDRELGGKGEKCKRENKGEESEVRGRTGRRERRRIVIYN